MEKIAVIILTKNNFKLFKNCLDSFVKNNTYTNLKFYIGDTGSSKQTIKNISNYIKAYNYAAELISFKRYNFAKNNNWIVKNRVKEDLVLFCNDDIKIENDCLPDMVKLLTNEVATVGCKLLYPNNTIQHLGHLHCGVLLDDGNYIIGAHHLHLNEPDRDFDATTFVHGNTFAFCLVNKNTYLKYRGLDEDYEVCFEDVNFCLTCMENGLKHLCVSNKFNYHIENATRNTGIHMDPRDTERIVFRLTEFYNKITLNEKFTKFKQDVLSFVPPVSVINY